MTGHHEHRLGEEFWEERERNIKSKLANIKLGAYGDSQLQKKILLID